MMTTMAALVGTLPITLGLGARALKHAVRALGLAAGYGLVRVAPANALHYARALHLYGELPQHAEPAGRRLQATPEPAATMSCYSLAQYFHQQQHHALTMAATNENTKPGTSQ